MEDRVPPRKRPFAEHDDTENNSSAQKKVRFPKGKKMKVAEDVGVSGEIKNGSEWRSDPRLVATERSRRRSGMTTEICREENEGIIHDIGAAEVDYEGNENFYDDGIQIEPFNLEKEREQGYFDAAGNYVEYIDSNEIKDAWLDNIEFDSGFSGKIYEPKNINDDSNDLSSDEIAKIKRRIADILEPGETVLSALKRLKGNSKNKKAKMPPETKYLFDQLTEGAMKLMDNGDYNVYHESQEVFEREAEGYESLSRARRDVTSISDNRYAYGSQNMIPSTTASSITGRASLPNAPVEDAPSNDNAEPIDIFTEEDDATDGTEQPTYNANVLESINTAPQASSARNNEALESTIIVPVWAITMIHLQICFAMRHQENGTHIMRKRAHMLMLAKVFQASFKVHPGAILNHVNANDDAGMNRSRSLTFIFVSLVSVLLYIPRFQTLSCIDLSAVCKAGSWRVSSNISQQTTLCEREGGRNLGHAHTLNRSK